MDSTPPAPAPSLQPPPPAGATKPSDLVPAVGAPAPKQISMLHVLRLFFIIAAGVVGWQICVLLRLSPERKMLGILFGMLVAFAFVLAEVTFTRRYIGLISAVMFGLIAGFLLAWLALTLIHFLPFFQNLENIGLESGEEMKTWLQFAVTLFCCYISVMAILQSREDFKFVIPFVELTRQSRPVSPLVMDTSVIIDGRIADIIDTRLIAVPLLVPRFVLTELQAIADSADRLKRNRGRRGLDILNRMRKAKGATLEIYEAEIPDVLGTDSKLCRLTKTLGARLLTNDFNLNRVAQVQGIEVVNLNDLAHALRPVVLPGEPIEIRILKVGEEAGQGVGYLDDGTMVVIDGAAAKVGQKITATVTSSIQTSAGRMIFGAVRG
ncbi:MAG: TRAM domain-containing protein [Planctomycetes bacterium]|nr:TRAM domain-containing protein [Planctomycetota bacterium]